MILKNLYNVLEQGVLKKIMLNKLDLKVKKKNRKEKNLDAGTLVKISLHKRDKYNRCSNWQFILKSKFKKKISKILKNFNSNKRKISHVVEFAKSTDFGTKIG